MLICFSHFVKKKNTFEPRDRWTFAALPYKIQKFASYVKHKPNSEFQKLSDVIYSFFRIDFNAVCELHFYYGK